MKTILIKCEVPDDNTKPLKVFLGMDRIQHVILTPPTEEEIEKMLPKTGNSELLEKRGSFLNGIKWYKKLLGI